MTEAAGARRVQQVAAFGAADGGLVGRVVEHGEHPRHAVQRVFADQGTQVSVGAVLDVRSTLAETAGGQALHTLAVHYRVGPPNGELPAQPTRASGHPRVQRSAAYALIVSHGRILLTSLAHDDRWTLPGGGIDFGEDPRSAVRREVMEETGLVLADPALLEVDSRHFTGRAPTGRLEDYHAVRFLFAGSVPEDSVPVVQEVGGTTDAAAWVPLAELRARPLVPLVSWAVASQLGPQVLA